jgi:1-acyl-sn-glycerol-3-phosphate acyltransferase
MAGSVAYTVPLQNRIGRRILRFIGRGILYPVLSRPEIIGLENIPKKSGYIIAFNHLSIFDPPFLICYWPYPPEWIGAAEVFREKDKKIFAIMYGGIPLDRDHYDRQALTKAEDILKSGYPLMMAPEMRITRQPGMRQARPGISFLVQRTCVPVLPVGITGTPLNFMQEVIKLRRPRLTMRVGNLISLPEIGENRKADMQRNADIVMANIAMLLPEKYRGYYSDYEAFLA